MGLADSAAEFFPEAAWQRCIAHWYRNIFSHVPSTKVREIAAMLKAIHAGEDIVAARQKAVQVIEKLRGLRLTNAAELVAAAIEETLAYYALPGGALEAYPHQQPARAYSKGDQAPHPCGRCIPRRPIRPQPCRGQAAPDRRHRVVDQTLSEHRAAEGPADERCHHRLSQCRAPLSQNHMCEKLWALPNFPPRDATLPRRDCQCGRLFPFSHPQMFPLFAYPQIIMPPL